MLLLFPGCVQNVLLPAQGDPEETLQQAISLLWADFYRKIVIIRMRSRI